MFGLQPHVSIQTTSLLAKVARSNFPSMVSTRGVRGNSVERSTDRLPGGLADKKTEHDFESKQLRRGTAVEHEHTDDRGLAREIAMDHLTEDPDYYIKLRKIEKTSSLFARVRVGKSVDDSPQLTVIHEKDHEGSKRASLLGSMKRADIVSTVTDAIRDAVADFLLPGPEKPPVPSQLPKDTSALSPSAIAGKPGRIPEALHIPISRTSPGLTVPIPQPVRELSESFFGVPEIPDEISLIRMQGRLPDSVIELLQPQMDARGIDRDEVERYLMPGAEFTMDGKPVRDALTYLQVAAPLAAAGVSGHALARGIMSARRHGELLAAIRGSFGAKDKKQQNEKSASLLESVKLATPASLNLMSGLYNAPITKEVAQPFLELEKDRQRDMYARMIAGPLAAAGAHMVPIFPTAHGLMPLTSGVVHALGGALPVGSTLGSMLMSGPGAILGMGSLGIGAAIGGSYLVSKLLNRFLAKRRAKKLMLQLQQPNEQ